MVLSDVVALIRNSMRPGLHIEVTSGPAQSNWRMDAIYAFILSSFLHQSSEDLM
jgi:hypothetical protein